MRNYKNSLGILLSFIFLLFAAGRTQACDRSSLLLNSVTPLGGGQYALSLKFCVGAGTNGMQDGAGNDTYTFAFFLSDNAAFASQPSQIVSPQTGYVYLDTTAGTDTLVYYSENFFNGPYEPWACISASCGPIQTVCMDIILITTGLPDSLWMGGAEGAGNISAGCHGPDMTVYPASGGCTLQISGSVTQPVCAGSTGSITVTPSGGTAPYTCTWSNGATTSSISNLNPGTYSVTVQDAGTCFKTGSYIVNAPPSFTCNLGPDKTVYHGYSPMSCALLSPSIVGGVGPFTYQWSGGGSASSKNVCPTATASYTVSVTDSRGCQVTDVIQVNVVDVRCGSNNQKVLVCHNGSTYCLPSSQVASHLNHGDALGSCQNKAGEAGAAMDAATEFGISAYPVPASDRIHFRIQSPEEGQLSLDIFDLQGQRVTSQMEIAQAEDGNQEITVHVADWAAGIYLARVSHSSSGVQNLKFTVVK